MYRGYKNLVEMGVTGLKYSPGWAAGAFFVPILNLFRPCQIAQEMWRASDPDAVRRDGPRWEEGSGSVVIGFWWAFWIISGIFQQINFRATLSGVENDVTRGASIISDSLSILAALCAIVMVRSLRARQVCKLEALWEQERTP
jgi:hypothetical protein